MNLFAGKAQGLVRYSPVLPVILVILWAIGSMAEDQDYLYCIETLNQDDRLDLFHWQVCNHSPTPDARSFPNSKFNTQGRALSNPKAPRSKKRCRRRNTISERDIKIPRKVYSNMMINKEDFWNDLQECCKDRGDRCFYLLNHWEIVGCDPWEDWYIYGDGTEKPTQK